MMQQGLVVVKSNTQLNQEEAAAVQAKIEAEERAQESVASSLASHIRQFWEVAYRHKEPVEKQMLESVRQLAGRYSDAKAEEIKASGLPLIYMKITSVKCRAAKSWIRDVLMPAGDKPWSLKQTKIPSLPPEMKFQMIREVHRQAEEAAAATGQQIGQTQIQEAIAALEGKMKEKLKNQGEQRIGAMSEVIEDQLSEGGWETAFNDVISDIVDFPGAILKGPVLRRKKKMAWDENEGGLKVEDAIQPEVERVDPFSFYPAPGITEPNEGDCIEIHDYTPSEIFGLIGLPGYDEPKIRAVMRDHQLTGLQNWTRESLRSQKRKARGDTSTATNDEKTIEAMEYWGSVQGEKLLEWGMSEEDVPDQDAMYDIMAVMIGSHVVCVRINPDPLGNKPYSKACFEDIPGSFWGLGVPDLIRDCEAACNAAARSLIANMGISSGPQVAVNTQSLLPGEDIEQMYPWKIWQLDFSKSGQSGSRPPIEFFQPNPNTKALMDVFKEFSSLADEYSGIPAYSYGVGGSVGGAGNTASGLSMLMNAASKAIKNVVKHVDSGVITPTIYRYYVHNMLYHEDQSIKGDAQVIARGALSLVAKEQNQMRIQELLAQTGNEIDMSIIGIEGRAELLRKTMQGVDVSADFIPTDEELAQRQAQIREQQANGEANQ
jgi:hypothetical protein